MAHVVESVTIIDSTTAQGAWDSPFQGQPLDLVSWAGPNYITFDLACCHQTYMMVLCQSEGIDPPESLVDSIKHREQLRQELATFYKVDVEAIKALVNKTTYGWGCKSWRIQYGVHPFIEHPFIKQFYADMVGICDQLRRPHQYDKNGEPVDHRRHNEPLCVRTHFIQAQIMRCIRNRLHLRWGFDPDFMIELFDAVLVTSADAFNLHKEVTGASKQFVNVLNDLVDHIEEKFNLCILLTIKLPEGQEVASTREFELLESLHEGSHEILETSLPSNETFLDFDLIASHFTCLIVLCQAGGISPPQSLLECISRRSEIRKELADFYGCSTFAAKTLLNRLVDGCPLRSWKADFDVKVNKDHAFVGTFQRELVGLFYRLQVRNSSSAAQSDPRPQSWIPSLYYIQQQILARILHRLFDKHKFEAETAIPLFDGFALAAAAGTNMQKFYNFSSQSILDDVTAHILETSGVWVGLNLKFPGKVIPSTREFELPEGVPRDILIRPERADAGITFASEPTSSKKLKKGKKGGKRNKKKKEKKDPLVILQAIVRGVFVRAAWEQTSRELRRDKVKAGTLSSKKKKDLKKSADASKSDAEGVTELQVMLANLDLLRYYPKFEESKYQTLASMENPDMTDKYLEEMIGMKKLHLKRFRAAIPGAIASAAAERKRKKAQTQVDILNKRLQDRGYYAWSVVPTASNRDVLTLEHEDGQRITTTRGKGSRSIWSELDDFEKQKDVSSSIPSEGTPTSPAFHITVKSEPESQEKITKEKKKKRKKKRKEKLKDLPPTPSSILSQENASANPSKAEYLARLKTFYTYKNPDKIGTIEATLEKWAGHEQELFDMLEAKYGKIDGTTEETSNTRERNPPPTEEPAREIEF